MNSFRSLRVTGMNHPNTLLWRPRTMCSWTLSSLLYELMSDTRDFGLKCNVNNERFPSKRLVGWKENSVKSFCSLLELLHWICVCCWCFCFILISCLWLSFKLVGYYSSLYNNIIDSTFLKIRHRLNSNLTFENILKETWHDFYSS